MNNILQHVVTERFPDGKEQAIGSVLVTPKGTVILYRDIDDKHFFQSKGGPKLLNVDAIPLDHAVGKGVTKVVYRHESGIAYVLDIERLREANRRTMARREQYFVPLSWYESHESFPKLDRPGVELFVDMP